MNSYTKLLSTILVLTLLVALPVGAAFAGDSVTYDLMAGQNIDVGSVTVSDDGTNLIVAYDIEEEGWFIVQAHMYADVNAPRKSSPGRFPFHSGIVHDTSFTFTVALADLGVESGDELNVSAHAVVNNELNIIGYTDEIIGYKTVGYDCPTLEEIAGALPEYAKMQIFGDGSGYYDVKIDLDGDGAFATDGSESFDWYCIDHTHSIGLGVYTVRVFSSYETLPDAIVNNGTSDNNVDHPENLDLVNWVINNSGSISQTQQQDVIWALLDDDPAKAPGTLDAAELAVYNEALNQDGFVPADGQNLAIVLQPVDASDNSIGQVTIGQVTIGQVSFATLGLGECTPIEEAIYDPIYQSETGWASAEGDGVTYFKQGWGSYFTYGL